ncbi:MAG: hypothetical protein M0Z51_14520 [Propionibacterium sp.]|nr:hypothetical protein [Propionibacterium sp.]
MPRSDASGTGGGTGRRPLVAILTALLTFLVAGAVSLPAVAQVVPYETAREKGALPEHGLVSFAPWEVVDPWSLNVMLSYVDFDLPGNAGFNLVVRRVYNSKDGAWIFDMGMPHMLLATGVHPRMVNGDGRVAWMVRDLTQTNIYWSTTFWRYNATTGTLQSPAGITYTFDTSGRPLTATDPFGNQQIVTWSGGQIANIVQTLGNGQSREVDFGYDAEDHVVSLSCQGRTWQYAWASDQLVQASSPAGPAWTFAYASAQVGQEDESAITVTTPTGGWVRYVSRMHLDASPIGYDPRWDSFTVRWRQTGGPGVADATWQFTYPSDGTPTTTIDGISGVTYHAEYTFSNDGTYWTVPVLWATIGTGDAVQSLYYTWQDGVLLGSAYCAWLDGDWVPFGPARALLPRLMTVQRNGHFYTRDFQYVPDRFNHFGQPNSVTSSGDFVGSTSFQYQAFSAATYLADKPLEAVVDGVTAAVTYDPDTGFVTTQTVGGVTTTFTPDDFGNVGLRSVGGTQNTTFEHSWGALSLVAAPQSTVTLGISPDGTVGTATENGHATEYTYDAGRLVTIQPPTGHVTEISYASDGSSVTRSRGSVWSTRCLDGFGRTAFTFDSTGARTDVEYDALGRVRRQTLPYTTTPAPTSCTSPVAEAPPAVSFEYDALGRMTKRTNADGTYTTVAYDSTELGLRTTITDELGHVTRQIQQASGTPSNVRVHSVTNAMGDATTYAYDTAGNLNQVTTPNGLSKTWLYDSQSNRLQSETQPESGSVTYTYDDLGRLETRSNPTVGVTTYTYDASNRVTHVATEPPLGVDPTATRAYDATVEYDASGNRLSASNGYVASQFEYDEGLRLTKRIDEITGRRFETGFTYDDDDNLIGVRYPSGNHVSYDYDTNNRLVRVYDDARGLEFARDFTYRPSGALASYTSGNGIINTVTFDDETEQPTHIASSGSVLDLAYSYDDAGNVTEILDGRQGQNATYQYDALRRLTAATGPWGTLAYGYDAVGNRTSSIVTDTATPPVSTATTYSYGSATNRLVALLRGGTQFEGFDYDSAGRLTQDSRIDAYTYTPANLVESARTYAGALTTYRYDADGQRVLSIAGSETSRTYAVNELSEFSTEGGPIRWTVDYVRAGGRLLAAVRPASTADSIARPVTWRGRRSA